VHALDLGVGAELVDLRAVVAPAGRQQGAEEQDDE
jgi:hypothetical protein